MALLIAFVSLLGVATCDQLQNDYLPPITANSAGGARFLTAPAPSIFRTSGIGTSYAAPPSGPVPSGLYGAPATRTSSSGSYYSGTPTAILRLNNENNGDGSYRFDYETDNGISQQEQGHLENVGSGHESSVVHGSYSYQAPDGQTITVNYVADENGYRPVGDHLPTPPPIPDVILRSLEINASASRSGSSEGDYDYSSSSSFGSSQATATNQQYLPPRTGTNNGGYRY